MIKAPIELQFWYPDGPGSCPQIVAVGRFGADEKGEVGPMRAFRLAIVNGPNHMQPVLGEEIEFKL